MKFTYHAVLLYAVASGGREIDMSMLGGCEGLSSIVMMIPVIICALTALFISKK